MNKKTINIDLTASQPSVNVNGTIFEGDSVNVKVISPNNWSNKKVSFTTSIGTVYQINLVENSTASEFTLPASACLGGMLVMTFTGTTPSGAANKNITLNIENMPEIEMVNANPELLRESLRNAKNALETVRQATGLADLSGFVTKAEKGLAGGVASLDSSGKVPANQLPVSGIGEAPNNDKIYGRKAVSWMEITPEAINAYGTASRPAEDSLKLGGVSASYYNSQISNLYSHVNEIDNNVYTKTQVDALIASVFHYKGSVATPAQLPASGNKVGDVYDVLSTGDNYAWSGSAWDRLSGVVDLSPYYQKSEADALLDQKVDKVANKGLSTNDYTDTERNKLSTVEQGSQSNKIERVLKNGTEIETVNKIVNITVPTTPYDIGAASVQDLANVLNVADSKVAEAQNDGLLYGRKNNNWSEINLDAINALGKTEQAADSQKLGGFSSEYYAVKNDVYTKYETGQLLQNGLKYKGTATNFASLPLSGIDVGDVYLLDNGDFYVYTFSNGWKNLGYTDLSSYYTKGDVNNLLSAKVDSAPGKGLSTFDYTYTDKYKVDNIENDYYQKAYIDNRILEISDGLSYKVDKIYGKGLSTNDYGDSDKIKLSNLENTYYNKTEINNSLIQKVDKEAGKGLSTNDYTNAEKNKLVNIQANAQANVIENILVNGSAVTPTNKTVDISIPTVPQDIGAATADNVTQLTNQIAGKLDVTNIIAGANVSLGVSGKNITIHSTGGGSGGGIADAPFDGKVYGRTNGAWNEIEGSTENIIKTRSLNIGQLFDGDRYFDLNLVYSYFGAQDPADSQFIYNGFSYPLPVIVWGLIGQEEISSNFTASEQLKNAISANPVSAIISSKKYSVGERSESCYNLTYSLKDGVAEISAVRIKKINDEDSAARIAAFVSDTNISVSAQKLQPASDPNLNTVDKNVAGAINEVYSKLGAGNYDGEIREVTIPLGSDPAPASVYIQFAKGKTMAPVSCCDYSIAPIMLSQLVASGASSEISLQDLRNMFYNQIKDIRVICDMDYDGGGLHVAMQASDITYMTQSSSGSEIFIWNYLAGLPGDGGLTTALYTTTAQSDGTNIQFNNTVTALNGGGAEDTGESLIICDELSSEVHRLPVGYKAIAKTEYRNGEIPKGVVAEVKAMAFIQNVDIYNPNNNYYRYFIFNGGFTCDDGNILGFEDGSRFYSQNGNIFFSVSGQTVTVAQNGEFVGSLSSTTVDGVEYRYFDINAHKIPDPSISDSAKLTALGWTSVNIYQDWVKWADADGKNFGFVSGTKIDPAFNETRTITIQPNEWNYYSYSIYSNRIKETSKVEFGLPAPTSRANADAFNGAGIIISSLQPNSITFNAAVQPTSDITIAIKGVKWVN
jgi:hypothetical protein